MSRASSGPRVSVSATVPAFYQHVFRTLEPIMTLAGVVGTIQDPARYVAAVGGHTAPALPGRLHFLYTQLCGSWLALGWFGAMLLRASDDARVWRAWAIGMLLSDVVYAHSCAEAMGGWAAFVRVGDWSAMDWVVFWTSSPLAWARLAFVLGVGCRADGGTKKE